MDEREFVERRQSSWKLLADILSRCDSDNLYSLSREDLRQLGPLYRRAASDLAYARAHAVTGTLVQHLNQLVARSYSLLYQVDTRPRVGFRQLFVHDFPDTFRRRYPFFLVSLLITVLGFFVAYALVAHSQQNIDIFVPPHSEFQSSLDQWAEGKVSSDVSSGHSAIYASFLMQNNIRCSFVAFAFGILGGILTVYVLFENGLLLGAFAGYVMHMHQLKRFWPGIIPHGVVELSAIMIAGAAGLSLGWALLAPGAYCRKDALMLAARDSVRMVLGTILLLLFAGVVEGFISHSMLPPSLKIILGICSGVGLYGYLLLSGRNVCEIDETNTGMEVSKQK